MRATVQQHDVAARVCLFGSGSRHGAMREIASDRVEPRRRDVARAILIDEWQAGVGDR